MRIAPLLAALALIVACKREAPPPSTPPAVVVTEVPSDAAPVPIDAPPPEYRESETVTPDPKVVATGKTHMVVTESDDATKVGHAVLQTGGNAVDAAVATALTLAVTHPSAGNLTGGGFAVVRIGKGKATTLDFRETAPAVASRDMYLDDKGQVTRASLEGWRASGVPGSVAGLYALHQKLGKKPWKELVQPAIDLARNGFVLDEHSAWGLAARVKLLEKNPASAAFWLPGGKPREAGETVVNTELATVLERIRDKGADGFYKGPTAKAINDAMAANGGTITAADLAGYKAVWRDPLRFAYRGASVVSMPLPSSGGLVLAMTAGILRTHELGKLPWHGAEHTHFIIEAWRRAYSARNGILGDPGYVKEQSYSKLLVPAYLDKLAATITDKATKSADVPPLLEGDHTTNLCVVDASGMAVVITTTLNTGWGSGVTISGMLMNNEMDDFASKPGSANVYGLVQLEANKIEPGKRMLSSMSPTFVEDAKGDLLMMVGAQGGPRIISAVWQTLSNVVDFGKGAGEALALPRFHHQHLPDKVFVEARSLTKETADDLTGRGYTLEWTPALVFDPRTKRQLPARGFGAANAIVRTANGWEASADPREGGAALGDH